MKNRLIFLALVWLITGALSSCQSKKDNSEKAPEQAGSTTYPQLSRDEFMQLYNTADQVDIIFFNHPVSVSQDNQASVRNTVLYISPQAPAQVSSHCKALGRLTWMSQGTILHDADVYVEEGCQYLLFMKDNKPVAAHALAKEGLEFFDTILRQVKERMQ